MGRIVHAALPAFFLSIPLAAQPLRPADPIELPRLDLVPECRGAAGEIVVCARRPTERYRIPPELREGPPDRRDYSWSARARDEREVARYEDQVSGPGGWLNYSRQRDCQWRAERQQIMGQQVDCTRRVQPLPGETR